MRFRVLAPAAFAAACGFSACANGPMDPLDLIVTDVVPHPEHPELSVLPDGTVQQRYLVQVRSDLFFAGVARDVITELAVENDIVVERVYDTVYGGFAAALSDAQVAALRARPDVENVVPTSASTL